MLPPPVQPSRARGLCTAESPSVAGVGVAIVAAYIGGMLLNDVIDQSFDEKHHPDRPLPQGLIPRFHVDRCSSFLRHSVFDSGWWLCPNRSRHLVGCDWSVFLASQNLQFGWRLCCWARAVVWRS